MGIPLVEIPWELAKSHYRYDKKTGKLFRTKIWEGHAGGRLPELGEVGNKLYGRNYLVFRPGLGSNKLVLAHRFIWFLITGHWPIHGIDHVDGNGLNNRWQNLRLASQVQNMQNEQGPRKNNKTGFLGVHICGNRFKACIRINGEHTYLGLYPTAEEAYRVYLEAKRKHHKFNTL